MATPYIGEIRMFGGNFAPIDWSFCNGSLLPIDQNSTLFNLIGTTYGGDGQTTFALPDLRSRFPVHQGPGFIIGQTGGAETVTVTVSQLPAHSHVPQCLSTDGSAGSPANDVWAASSINQFSNVAPPTLAMNPAAIGNTGGSQPHDNMIPYLAVNFILSLFGIYPTQ